MVSAATRAEHVAVLLTRCPETMARAVDSAAELRPLLDKASVVVVGPGLGCGEWGEAMLAAALAEGLPTVIDADGLNLHAASSKKTEPQKTTGMTVITPHPGEAARLLGMTVAEIERDRIGFAQRLAAQCGGVVVWKGAGSIVAMAGEIPVIIDAGNPGMATGGMGDVLTGVIGAILAQRGQSHFEAAVCGALLHAAAGDAAARDGGERGLLPSDLFPHLRRLANPASHA